jgi:hypothetical protein
VPQWNEREKYFGQGKLHPAPHPVYSRDVSPHDFWLFGMLKQRMTDRQLQSPKEILDAFTELWDAVTFEELQNVFLAWMERLQCVVQNGGEYFIN